MSDLQESAHYDPRSLRSIEILLDECQPDLVVWGGDNCYGPEIKSEQDLIDFLDIFTEPMEKRKIPWVHIFGNHDHDAPVPIERQQEIYESYTCCISLHTDQTIHGKSNFMLPVCGIRLLWDACVGYRCYGVDERRGGRLFIYNEDDPAKVNTTMIRTYGKL